MRDSDEQKPGEHHDDVQCPCDRRAWEAVLLENHKTFMNKSIHILVADGHDADDALEGFQEACVQIWHRKLFDEARGTPTAEQVFQFVFNRAEWRTLDIERKRHQAMLGEDLIDLEANGHVGQVCGVAQPAPAVDEQVRERDDNYWLAGRTVVDRFPSARLCAIDRCLEGEPYRAVAHENGVSSATLCRQVCLFKDLYAVLGTPGHPTYDVLEVRRLRRLGVELVVKLASEVHGDGVRRRVPCTQSGRVTAWICELSPAAERRMK